MVSKEKLVEVFVELGIRLQHLPNEERMHWKREAEIHNRWFTEANVEKALESIVFLLRKAHLEKWVEAYSIPAASAKKIGVVMAGNIPMVGFHDMLCVLLSGHIVVAKLSSDDTILMKKIVALLISIEPAMASRIEFAERLNGVDAVIATGSDNTAKHFEYYFSKIPRIIRRNRVSVAVLTGNETNEELTALGADMLQYFGLGCRNVSKLYIPRAMTLNVLYEALEPWKVVADNAKYGNNYDYNRSIFLLKSILHLDNGFLLAIETTDLVSAIAVVYYERYDSIEEVNEKLKAQEEKIQCIVASDGVLANTVCFGAAQQPNLWDYADGVDTMKFLLTV